MQDFWRYYYYLPNKNAQASGGILKVIWFKYPMCHGQDGEREAAAVCYYYSGHLYQNDYGILPLSSLAG